ncbi:MAG: hypothetical protein H6713_01280 [Myxococcales bacterium]|nr:hypothetical protein [Myxococcales bacterium]MCB9748615.1 hypothetical protein [Myxococcales bacterium]
MADSQVELEAPEAGLVRVRVSGFLNGSLAARLLERLRDAPQDDDEGERLGLVIDLRELRDFDDVGYERLVAAQRELKSSERRTAYLISRPRIRGMVFKVIHITQDERTRPVTNLAMARAWLTRQDERSYAETSLDRAKTLLERIRQRSTSRAAESA